MSRTKNNQPSPSKRLRNVTYKLWEKQKRLGKIDKKLEFEDYYETIVEWYINQIKEKL